MDVEFRNLEQQFDARLGVYAIDTATGRSISYRAEERFAYASTHKALTAAVLLQQKTTVELDEVIHYTAGDLVANSPVTEQHVGLGMTLRELADAAIRRSDNTAANLLLAAVGGPGALDAALEAIGDDTTQVDRIEPTLNEAIPGDTRDTSTARALATDLRAFALADALPTQDRQQLIDWMTGNATGATLIRAGVPAEWTVADKSGAGGYGTRNDIAILWRPDGAPIVLAVMSDRSNADTQYADGQYADAQHDDTLIAETARVVAAALS